MLCRNPESDPLLTGQNLELDQAHMGGNLLLMAGWVDEEDKRSWSLDRGQEEQRNRLKTELVSGAGQQVSVLLWGQQ